MPSSSRPAPTPSPPTATPWSLSTSARTGFAADGASLIALSGQLAREAAGAAKDRKVLVCGSLPPIFGSYEPQNFDPGRVQDYLQVMVDSLAPHVDVWLAETLSLIAEADAVGTAVKATGKPLWVSFTLDDKPGATGTEPALRSGETVAEAARWASANRIQALLFNCSKPEVMEAAIRTTASVFSNLDVSPRIGVYANAFDEETDEKKANDGLSGMRAELDGDGYLGFARTWTEAGATMVGGCCGIGVEQIGRLARELKA
jgi:S-methylmethionine-dependent homocysteine/selenocysteine methylase